MDEKIEKNSKLSTSEGKIRRQNLKSLRATAKHLPGKKCMTLITTTYNTILYNFIRKEQTKLTSQALRSRTTKTEFSTSFM